MDNHKNYRSFASKTGRYVVCGIHGEEQTPVLQIRQRADNLKEAGIGVIYGNPRALKQGVRFIEENINLCFPGNGRTYEGRRAKFIHQNFLRDSFRTVDLHTAGVGSPPFGIVTRIGNGQLQFACQLGLPYVVYMQASVVNRKSLIDHAPCAVAVELGKEGNPLIKELIYQVINRAFGLEAKTKPKIGNHRTQILLGVGFLEKPATNAKLQPDISPFSEVRKGQVLHIDQKGKILDYATQDFIAILPNEPSYKNRSCIMAVRSKREGEI